ncbi:retron St85 family RNA-directed DNA polymerase [Gluconobacter cerinus]|uniref:retron St85 family RNA-directed DNA polymerase n=1 Tax=Gluconobacter cerinus TaxID=38307 RepID=UPI001B8B4639|nr:retron St85 family RNA-directed DNA polymerase [Gluconobacter cerinus]MBS1069866.1 retron St85 family RNA-directed DNA polymerase [Gluconobacter cerinus]
MSEENFVTAQEYRFDNILQILSEETGLLLNDINYIISSAPKSYKTYNIPKRSGGTRTISQPARQVKILQKALIKNVLLNLPVHPAATAYQKGKSILNNAQPHQGEGRSILKIDFSEFFPSIKHFDWIDYCKKNRILNEQDQHYTSRILFKKEVGMRGLRLAIGAPSSPLLSNILMFDFDSAVNDLIVTDKIAYTRYADDLTFSAPRAGYFGEIEKKLRTIIRGMSHPKLKIKEEKTVRATPKFKRSVTGLILTNQGKTSIGRDKKRIISASVHHAKNNNLSQEQMKKLSGYLAYIKSIEPSFLDYLRRKYGEAIMDSLRKMGHPDYRVEN